MAGNRGSGFLNIGSDFVVFLFILFMAVVLSTYHAINASPTYSQLTGLNRAYPQGSQTSYPSAQTTTTKTGKTASEILGLPPVVLEQPPPRAQPSSVPDARGAYDPGATYNFG